MIDIKNISTHCTRSEFVGKAVLDTIGLVISGIDDTLLKEMNIGTKYHCLGLFSSRTGAAGQLTALDLPYLPRRLQGGLLLSNGTSHLEGGFTLRCLQRLSLPDLATRP